MKWLVLRLLEGYKLFLSPLLPAACRYEPTCSVYMMQSVQRFGVARGVWMGLRRLGRCHPGYAGGWDPVPQLPDHVAASHHEHCGDEHNAEPERG